jgi:hypothetical protein
MSISQLSDKLLGNQLGLAYLDDIVDSGVATISYNDDTGALKIATGFIKLESSDGSVNFNLGTIDNSIDITSGSAPVPTGVASIGYTNAGTPVVLTGAIILQSADGSVDISSGGAGIVDFSTNPTYGVYSEKSITVEGEAQQIFIVNPADNGNYWYFTTTTDGIKHICLHFDSAFPVNGRIYVRNAGDSSLLNKLRVILAVKKGAGASSPIEDITNNAGTLYSSTNSVSNSPWLVVIQTSEGVFNLF